MPSYSAQPHYSSRDKYEIPFFIIRLVEAKLIISSFGKIVGKLVFSQRAAGHLLWRVGSVLIQWDAKVSTWLSTYMLIHCIKKYQ